MNIIKRNVLLAVVLVIVVMLGLVDLAYYGLTGLPILGVW